MEEADDSNRRRAVPTVRIDAKVGGGPYWMEVIGRGELLRALVVRDLAVRYRQTTIGVAWVILQPLSVMVLLTVVFSLVARLPAPAEVPYALLVLSGLAPWQFFSSALSNASTSLVQHSNLVTKTYFPRLLVPLAAVAVGAVDLLVTTVLLCLGLVLFGRLPGPEIALLPVFILVLVAATAGLGAALAALNARYRDFRYIVPFLLQFGLYATPVAYSLSFVPEPWRAAFALNPLVGVIEGFRWCVLGDTSGLDATVLGISGFSAAGCCILGLIWFRRTEVDLADDL